MDLYYYPLSRYSQKVLIAFYEKQIDFLPHLVNIHNPVDRQEFEATHSTCKLPLLKCEDDELIWEPSSIIKYIELNYDSGTILINEQQQIQIKRMDELVDQDVNAPLDKIDRIRQMPAEDIDQIGLKRLQKSTLKCLEYLDQQLAENYWLCGEQFSLADCTLIPCLPSARKELGLFELEHLNRYWQQSLLRGSWALVQAEIIQAKLNAE